LLRDGGLQGLWNNYRREPQTSCPLAAYSVLHIQCKTKVPRA
jgi:hypothetical protein